MPKSKSMMTIWTSFLETALENLVVMIAMNEYNSCDSNLVFWDYHKMTFEEYRKALQVNINSLHAG